MLQGDFVDLILFNGIVVKLIEEYRLDLDIFFGVNDTSHYGQVLLV
jgi:hypothetical protein